MTRWRRALQDPTRGGPDGRPGRDPCSRASRPGAGSARSASTPWSLSRLGGGRPPVPVHRARARPASIAALAYGAALGRVPRIRLLAGLPVGAALVLLVERLLMASGHPATVPLAWLTVYAVGAIGVTIAWTMAGVGVRCPPGQAPVPAVHGGGDRRQLRRDPVVRPGRRAVGTETLIVLEAGLLALVGLLVVGGRADDDGPGAHRARRDRSMVDDLRVGFDEVVRSPLMRLVAIAYVLLADPDVLRDLPVPARRVGDLPVRSRAWRRRSACCRRP